MKNAIFEKEIKLGSRTIKLPLAIILYGILVDLIAVFSLMSACNFGQTNMYRDSVIDYNSVTGCFQVISFFLLFMIGIIIPVITASSIAGEREKQTLDIMLTAPISPSYIVVGKLFAALCNIFMYIVVSFPALAISFIFGGINVISLVEFLVYIFVFSFFIGAIGIWCSAVFNKTIVSIVMSFIVELIVLFAPVIITGITVTQKAVESEDLTTVNSALDLGYRLLILFLTPALGYVGIGQGTGEGFGGMMNEILSEYHSSKIVEFAYGHTLIISLVVTFLYGLLFIYLAARKIDSIRLQGVVIDSIEVGNGKREINEG